MSNWTCPKCSEQWDTYGIRHGDVNKYEADAMEKGLGCPACSFDEDPIPDEVELFVCAVCETSICISPDSFRYNGNEVVVTTDYPKHYDDDRGRICEDCYHIREQCDYCKQYYYDSGETTYIQHNHTVVCNECLESGIVSECLICGQLYDSYDLQKMPNDTRWVCESCFDQYTTTCTGCGKLLNLQDPDDCFDIDGDHFCERCVPEEDEDEDS